MNKEKQQWRNLLKKVKTDEDTNKKDAYHLYAGKFRKSAVKTNPVTRNLNPVLKCRNFDEKPIKKPDPYEYDQFVGSNVLNENKWLNNNCEEWINSVETRIWMLNEFRRVYRQLERSVVMKPSVRRDMIARKEMMKKYKYFEPTQIVGQVPGVKIGDVFDLRVELMIMGLHFQLIHGIDFMITCPYETLLATSVVATEGYDDNLMDNDVVWYKGEGGNFEGGGGEKGKMGKDQVWKRGNLALRNCMRKRNEVRVIRGLKCGWEKKVVFVYDGLYTVDDCREIRGHCGNKEFEFKLVRCPGQRRIIWSRYRYNSCKK